MGEVLVIGSNGQLGVELINILNKMNISSEGLDHSQIEVKNFESAKRKIQEISPKIIINTSAFHKVDLCEEEPEESFKVNSLAVKNLAEICKDEKIKLAHISTDYVFDGRKGGAYDESDFPNPLGVYGNSKLSGECFIRSILKEHFIIRTSAIQGKSKSSVKGSNFIETMLKLGKENKRVKVVNDQIITPTYAVDLAEKIIELIQTTYFGTYHITNKGEISWYEFAKKIFELSNLEVLVEPINSEKAADLFKYKIDRPANSSLKNVNLEKMDFRPMRHWEDALKSYLEERKETKFKIEKEILNGLKVIVPRVMGDERGFFSEVYREDEFRKIGIYEKFVQDNHSGSVKGVLRGLHFQWEPPMGKLMRVTKGEAYLVAVDVRKGSPTFGQWHGEIVSDKNRKMVWAPAGFARGFYVISDYAEIQYKCTGIYNNKAESGILWNDSEVGIEWPTRNEVELILSDKDKNAQTLREWNEKEDSNNFRF